MFDQTIKAGQIFFCILMSVALLSCAPEERPEGEMRNLSGGGGGTHFSHKGGWVSREGHAFRLFAFSWNHFRAKKAATEMKLMVWKGGVLSTPDNLSFKLYMGCCGTPMNLNITQVGVGQWLVNGLQWDFSGEWVLEILQAGKVVHKVLLPVIPS